MSEFSKGQRVRVEFEGEVINVLSGCHGPVTGLYVKQDGNLGDKAHYVYPKYAKVTPLDPPDWPPQVGDIWEKDGIEYHAEEWHRTSFDDVDLVLQPFTHTNDTYAYSDQRSYMKDLADFKALNPVLVRRRGQ